MRYVMSIIRFVHAWAGVALALLLMVISLTGTLLVWKEDYVRLVLPEARASFEATPASLARIAEQVEARYDNNHIMRLTFPRADFALAKVAVYPDRFAYLDGEGNLVTEWRGNGRPEEWLYDLHHRLLMVDTGLLIVGFGSMAMLLMVLTGLILWWPMRSSWRRGLWPRNTRRGELNRGHRHIGLLLSLPLLGLLITGIVLVFPAQTEDWLLSEIRRDEDYSMAMMEGVDEISGGDSGNWVPALERAQQVFPDSAIRSAEVPTQFSPYRIIGLQHPQDWHPLGMSRVYVEAEGGYMDIRIDAMGLPFRERAYNAMYPLHTARLDSRLYQVFLTLSGAGIFLLSGLGLFSFLRRWWRV